GAEGADPGGRGLCQGLQESGRADQRYVTYRGFPVGRQDPGPAGHVPERRPDPARQPGQRVWHLDPLRPGQRATDRLAGDRPRISRGPDAARRLRVRGRHRVSSPARPAGLRRGLMAIATRYQAVIGLEVHAQILTHSKMFCGCSTDYLTAPPNANTCPVCLALPGSLPVINRKAVEATIRTALALNCEIPEFTKFDRKNYFYPDLPKGYQISQYDLPLSRNGFLEFEVKGQPRRCGITRVHLEEDTGKLLHAGAIHEAQSSLVDLNRAGVPLMEIVSEPDLRSADDAREYFTRLRAILQYIGVNNGDMESGQLRCDANVSLRPLGATEYGTKVEIKNMNSFRAVHRAIEFEIVRQTEVLDGG